MVDYNLKDFNQLFNIDLIYQPFPDNKIILPNSILHLPNYKTKLNEDFTEIAYTLANFKEMIEYMANQNLQTDVEATKPNQKRHKPKGFG